MLAWLYYTIALGLALNLDCSLDIIAYKVFVNDLACMELSKPGHLLSQIEERQIMSVVDSSDGSVVAS